MLIIKGWLWEFEQWYVQEFNCEDRLASHEWGLPFCRSSEGICILFMLFGSQSSGETLYLCLVSLRVRLWAGRRSEVSGDTKVIIGFQ